MAKAAGQEKACTQAKAKSLGRQTGETCSSILAVGHDRDIDLYHALRFYKFSCVF
jgi:hypothetical protein